MYVPRPMIIPLPLCDFIWVKLSPSAGAVRGGQDFALCIRCHLHPRPLSLTHSLSLSHSLYLILCFDEPPSILISCILLTSLDASAGTAVRHSVRGPCSTAAACTAARAAAVVAAISTRTRQEFRMA
jgi:hypothetical protein